MDADNHPIHDHGPLPRPSQPEGPLARVLIVDDEQTIVRLWERILGGQFVVDSAQSLAEAKDKLAHERFDVVLLDLVLADGSGASLLPVLNELRPPPAVAVVSGHMDGEKVVNLHGRCYMAVPKPLKASTLTKLVTLLAERATVHSALSEFCRQHSLSEREAAVLQAATDGAQNKEIAAALGCAPSTVVTYWRRIFTKTSCRSRHEVLSALLRSHLRPPPS